MDQGKDAKTAPQAIDPVYAPRALENPVMNMKTPSMAAITQISVGFEGKVDPKAKTAAIILAGGSGERFGREGGKQMVEIAGRPILTWSAESFDAVPDVGQIVIVCPEDRMQEYKERAIDPFPFVTPVVFAPAGDLRQESAFSGDGAVAVHVRHLREKIEIDPAHPKYIKVVWGQGYKIDRGDALNE